MKLRVHAQYSKTFEMEMDFTKEDLREMVDNRKFPYMDKLLEQKKQTTGKWDIQAYDEYGNIIYDSWQSGSRKEYL